MVTLGTAGGLLVALLGVVLVARPLAVFRFRNRHSRDPDPSTGSPLLAVRVGGAVVVVMGLWVAL